MWGKKGRRTDTQKLALLCATGHVVPRRNFCGAALKSALLFPPRGPVFALCVFFPLWCGSSAKVSLLHKHLYCTPEMWGKKGGGPIKTCPFYVRQGTLCQNVISVEQRSRQLCSFRRREQVFALFAVMIGELYRSLFSARAFGLYVRGCASQCGGKKAEAPHTNVPFLWATRHVVPRRDFCGAALKTTLWFSPSRPVFALCVFFPIMVRDLSQSFFTAQAFVLYARNVGKKRRRPHKNLPFLCATGHVVPERYFCGAALKTTL